MIVFCKHLCKNLTFKVVLWLVEFTGLQEIPDGWITFDPEVARRRGVKQAVIEANPGIDPDSIPDDEEVQA